MAKAVHKAGQAKGPAKKTKQTAIVPIVNAKAMSKDVGPRVIRGLAQAQIDEHKANEILAKVSTKRYDLLSDMTLAVLKAAKADRTIDLTATVKGGDEGKKAMGVLNDQLGIALGFREVIKITGKDGEEASTVQYAKDVLQFFPSRADTDPHVKQQKTTLRSNFLTSLKKCATAALAILEKDITVKPDKESGTLMISGPEVKKTFGVDSVKLDERKNITDKKGQKIELKEKPSFTAVAAMAPGAAVHRGSNTRGRQVTDPGKALLGMAKEVVKACEALKASNRTPNDDEIKALESMQNAIESVLNA